MILDDIQRAILLGDLRKELMYDQYSRLNLKGLDPLRAEVDQRLHDLSEKANREKVAMCASCPHGISWHKNDGTYSGPSSWNECTWKGCGCLKFKEKT